MSIKFDEPVKASTVFGNITLRKTSDGSAAGFSWSDDVALDSDELRDTFWAQTQGLERGSRYWFQIEPGIEDALGNSTALQETPVATFSIYPQKGGIVYPRSNRVFQPKDPTKGFWMVFYEAIDETGAAAGGITLVNQNDESDTVSVAIAESYLQGQEKLYRFDPVIPLLPNQRYLVQIDMALLGSEGAYHRTISGVAVDTETTRLMVANDPTGVFSTDGSEGIITPGETLPLALSIDTGVGADGSSRELVSVDVRFTAVGLNGAEEYDLEFLNPTQVLVNGESRQVYDLSVAVPDIWQGVDSRRVVSSYVATLSDGTQIESSYDDVVLFWVPGISQSIRTLAALHAEVCASRPQGASSADVAGIWHLLGNCGYSAAARILIISMVKAL